MTFPLRRVDLRRSLVPIAFSLAAAAGVLDGSRVLAATRSPWVPDLGNGTYQNPVLHADYSDPDVIRVGDDFWLTSSSFNHAPGLPILHSRDLVNWEIVNYALPRQVPEDRYTAVWHGCGVWAPAIRYHEGKYYIYYPDPDLGIFVVTATDPRGAWSAPVLVAGGKGLIDPCPLWDDDGRAYLVHAWAHSRGPISNRLTLCTLSRDGLHALDEGRDIIDANKMSGWRTLEGPKLYKRAGWYYVFAPAGGVQEGYQAVFRSRSIYGPYENRIVLEQDGTPINGPHQGAWVDTPTGENWFLHFQDKGPFGRVVHLQPMAWRDDDWPVMGTAVKSGGEKGAPVLTYAKPAVAGGDRLPVMEPATTDEFDAPRLGLQWQWQANPSPEWYSLTERPGLLRLRTTVPPASGFYDSPSILLQKFPAPRFTVTVALDASGLGVNDHAGLIVYGYSYAWLGVRRTDHGLVLVQAINREHALRPPPKAERSRETSRPLGSPRVFVRVTVTPDARCEFSYSEDGARFTPIDAGSPFEASADRWVGATVGLFASRPAATDAKPGHADFDWFRVE